MSSLFITLILSLILGLSAGAIMHRSDFCMTAAFRDLFLFRSTTLLAALLILISTSSIFFEILRWAGRGIPSFGPPTLATLLGGVLFGVGMVLAGSCAVGTLYRLGSGSRLALWALIGMIAGSAMYAEIHLFWSEVKKSLALGGVHAASLPGWLGIPSWLFVLLLVVVTILLYLRSPQSFSPLPEWRELDGYIPPLYAALALSGVGILSVLFFGKPLGVTTSYAKFAAIVEGTFWPEYLVSSPFFQSHSSPVKIPFVPGSLPTGPGPEFDGIAVIQYPLILGIIFGSALSAWQLDEWRWSRGVCWRQTISVLCGGVLMGLSARMASGCNIWYLWGGLPFFSSQSLLFLFGLIPGAWLGSRLLLRWVLPEKVKGESE